jgi:hypothetical protein
MLVVIVDGGRLSPDQSPNPIEQGIGRIFEWFSKK